MFLCECAQFYTNYLEFQLSPFDAEFRILELGKYGIEIPILISNFMFGTKHWILESKATSPILQTQSMIPNGVNENSDSIQSQVFHSYTYTHTNIALNSTRNHC